MSHIFRSRPVLTEETHRATSFEIFFDLVFIFALTRVISLMGQPPTPLTLTQGLILLLLFWISWMTYSWLGNQARADIGLIKAGTILAMAATFVAALVIPDAWRPGNGTVDARLTLALAYVSLRVLHLAMYFYAAAGDRRPLRIFAIPTSLAWIPLVVGAMLGGTAQTVLWAAALVIDFSSGFIAAAFRQWHLRSPSHFAERHGLVLIIALGESLISVGAGAGSTVTRAPVLIAALLSFTLAVCLWWLYFESYAPAAGQAFAKVPTDQRGRFAADAYSLTHFPMIAGVIYLALGIEQVLAHLSHNQPQHPTGAPLDWTSTVALYGGVILYLAGRLAFLRFAVRLTPPAQLLAVGVALLLLPVSRILPALAALGLLTALLVVLVCYERFSGGERRTTGGGVPAT
jgi:low temperature requirement protein LtrA